MMNIIHALNVADFAFMAAGVGAAVLMIIVGGQDERRHNEEASRSPGRERGA